MHSRVSQLALAAALALVAACGPTSAGTAPQPLASVAVSGASSTRAVSTSASPASSLPATSAATATTGRPTATAPATTQPSAPKATTTTAAPATTRAAATTTRPAATAPVTTAAATRTQAATTAAAAPTGDCVIKGNINDKGEKIYHVPGQRFYDETKISLSKGERWFCSEEAAVAAGWRRSKV